MSERRVSAESEVLHDVIEGNQQSALEGLRDFYPSELRALDEHLRDMRELVNVALREKSAR